MISNFHKDATGVEFHSSSHSPNWYFVTKKGNRETVVNKITKQNNFKWKVSLEMKSTIKVKLK